MCNLQNLKIVYPPSGQPGAVEVTGRDLYTLRDEEYINDTIIDYGIYRGIQESSLRASALAGAAPRIYHEKSHFHKKVYGALKGLKSWQLRDISSCRVSFDTSRVQRHCHYLSKAAVGGVSLDLFQVRNRFARSASCITHDDVCIRPSGTSDLINLHTCRQLSKKVFDGTRTWICSSSTMC